MVLRLTLRCDLACPHCLAGKQPRGAELETGEWLSLIRQFPDIGVSKALLTGGEPLLRTDIAPLVEAISRVGIATDLNSNLQSMNPALILRLKDAGLSEISVSLDGPEEVHDRMRNRPGAYARLIEAIHFADQARIAVDASCCLTAENYRHVVGLIELVRATPVRSLTFSRLLPIGHGRAYRQPLSQAQLNACHGLIQDAIASGAPVPIRTTGLLGAPRAADCGRGQSLAGMSPDGSLLACVLAEHNPRIPHPLEAGLRHAWRMLVEELACRPYALCWQEGRST